MSIPISLNSHAVKQLTFTKFIYVHLLCNEPLLTTECTNYKCRIGLWPPQYVNKETFNLNLSVNLLWNDNKTLNHIIDDLRMIFPQDVLAHVHVQTSLLLQGRVRSSFHQGLSCLLCLQIVGIVQLTAVNRYFLLLCKTKVSLLHPSLATWNPSTYASQILNKWFVLTTYSIYRTGERSEEERFYLLKAPSCKGFNR